MTSSVNCIKLNNIENVCHIHFLSNIYLFKKKNKEIWVPWMLICF